MTRAERRRRAQVKINWRVRLYFTFYGWERSNRWYTEPHRLSKNNTDDIPYWCRGYRSDLAIQFHADECGEHIKRLAKHNRTTRVYADARLRRYR